MEGKSQTVTTVSIEGKYQSARAVATKGKVNLISKKFQIDKEKENMEEIDETPNAQLREHKDIREFIQKYEEVIQIACEKTVKQGQTYSKGKTVPWWSDALTILRKRTNALRRRFQRTTNNEELRENRKNRHFEEKKK